MIPVRRRPRPGSAGPPPPPSFVSQAQVARPRRRADRPQLPPARDQARPEQLDLDRFERLVQEAGETEPQEAAEKLRGALGLGAALACRLRATGQVGRNRTASSGLGPGHKWVNPPRRVNATVPPQIDLGSELVFRSALLTLRPKAAEAGPEQEGPPGRAIPEPKGSYEVGVDEPSPALALLSTSTARPSCSRRPVRRGRSHPRGT